LFSQQGTRSVGIDTIIQHSGVAKMTLYRHFQSKQELVAAFMELRHELWTQDRLCSEVKKRANTPRNRLLGIFDVFDEWFNRDGFEGCAFVKVPLEYQPGDPLHGAAVARRASASLFMSWRRRRALTIPRLSPTPGTSL
jgi:AcrR family transcriptional regulator